MAASMDVKTVVAEFLLDTDSCMRRLLKLPSSHIDEMKSVVQWVKYRCSHDVDFLQAEDYDATNSLIALFRRATADDCAVQRYIIETFVNASACSSDFTKYLVRHAPTFVRDAWILASNPEYANQVLCAALLSNLTIDVGHCRAIMRFHLIAADFHRLASALFSQGGRTQCHCLNILRNLSQLKEMRNEVVHHDSDDCSDRDGIQWKYFSSLLAALRSKEATLRKTAFATIRNFCIDSDTHTYLISQDRILLTELLYPLIGPEVLTCDENAQLPDDLQYMLPNKTREPDEEIRVHILETLYLLCMTSAGREWLRKNGTYYVLREYHKWEKSENADVLCGNVIGLLIRTEQEIGCDNIIQFVFPDGHDEKASADACE